MISTHVMDQEVSRKAFNPMRSKRTCCFLEAMKFELVHKVQLLIRAWKLKIEWRMRFQEARLPAKHNLRLTSHLGGAWSAGRLLLNLAWLVVQIKAKELVFSLNAGALRYVSPWMWFRSIFHFYVIFGELLQQTHSYFTVIRYPARFLEGIVICSEGGNFPLLDHLIINFSKIWSIRCAV